MKNALFRFKRFLFRSINIYLSKFGLILSKPDFIHGSPAFSGALVFSRRCFQTKDLLLEVKKIKGDIVEGGIHWGYGLLIELLLTEKKIHAFDSFKGHSLPTKKDKVSPNYKPFDDSFKVSLDDVKKTLKLGSNLNEIESRIKFIDGYVQDTMPNWLIRMKKDKRSISYVHADMDIYEPIKVILENTYPLLSKGAIVSVGRLDNPELLGKTAAFNEFLSSIDKNSIEIKNRIIIDTNGKKITHTYFVKL